MKGELAADREGSRLWGETEPRTAEKPAEVPEGS
jgi:hypothetical protein